MTIENQVSIVCTFISEKQNLLNLDLRLASNHSANHLHQHKLTSNLGTGERQ
eukprot:m.100904 g.100904  ORF g.100904 m.100904 type:complete len:52 (-) comp13729_c0_seq2:142-297(-)